LEDVGLKAMGNAAEFWRGRRVFLTGHTGFKGGWLALGLQRLGAEVMGYALAPPDGPNLYNVARVADGMRSVIGDIRDAGRLSEVMAGFRPEVVLHLAAQPLVLRSYVDPVETYSTNVMGTVNVLEAVRKAPSIRAVVNVTTDKCYENREWVWGYREDEAMGGYDPYSSSKGCAELVTSAYRRSFLQAKGVALASARAGNVIGGGDWAEDRLVADLLRAFTAGRPAVVRNPLSTRPWQHVLEPLSGYLQLARRLYDEGQAFAEGWNFGPHDVDARTVGWIADTLVAKWGRGASWTTDDRTHRHEAHYLKLDISKAKARLDWQPVWNLSQALSRIVDWQQAWMAERDMKAICLEQWDEFERDQSREASAIG
jgi:CDP-glucose 4,6-dehydratase